MVTNLRSIGKLLLSISITIGDAFCILQCIFLKFLASHNGRYRKKRFRCEFNYVFIHNLLVYKVINDSVNDIRNVLSEFFPGFLSGLNNYLTQFRKLRREILPPPEDFATVPYSKVF